MTRSNAYRLVRLFTCVLLLSGATAQGVTDEQRCLSGRAKAKGKYELCVEKWVSGAYRTGSYNSDIQPKLSRCRERYARAWADLQTLTGTTCDAPRWVNNGDGTTTDNLTGLVWEQKTDDGSVHDVDDLLTWTDLDADATDDDGPAFTTFLAALNAGAGFDDTNGWRLPSLAELLTILLPEPFPCTTSPCIDGAFGTFTEPHLYATHVSSAVNPLDAWAVSFIAGNAQPNGKSAVTAVRAVRGGH